MRKVYMWHYSQSSFVKLKCAIVEKTDSAPTPLSCLCSGRINPYSFLSSSIALLKGGSMEMKSILGKWSGYCLIKG